MHFEQGWGYLAFPLSPHPGPVLLAPLSEGWDVDNVFQIVPMEERVFNSKLLISQVLERDRTAFLSEDYETEVGEANKFVLDYINELRGRPEDKQQLSLFMPEDFVENRDEIIRTFVKGDTRPPFA